MEKIKHKIWNSLFKSNFVHAKYISHMPAKVSALWKKNSLLHWPPLDGIIKIYCKLKKAIASFDKAFVFLRLLCFLTATTFFMELKKCLFSFYVFWKKYFVPYYFVLSFIFFLFFVYICSCVSLPNISQTICSFRGHQPTLCPGLF